MIDVLIKIPEEVYINIKNNVRNDYIYVSSIRAIKKGRRAKIVKEEQDDDNNT